jgi:hypothetical protein
MPTVGNLVNLRVLSPTSSKTKSREQVGERPPKEQVLAARTEAGARALTPANNKEVVNKPAVREYKSFQD